MKKQNVIFKIPDLKPRHVDVISEYFPNRRHFNFLWLENITNLPMLFRSFTIYTCTHVHIQIFQTDLFFMSGIVFPDICLISTGPNTISRMPSRWATAELTLIFGLSLAPSETLVKLEPYPTFGDFGGLISTTAAKSESI